LGTPDPSVNRRHFPTSLSIPLSKGTPVARNRRPNEARIFVRLMRLHPDLALGFVRVRWPLC